MGIDLEQFEEYLNLLEDIYEPEELVLELGLTTRDIIEMFRDKIQEQPINLEKYRFE